MVASGGVGTGGAATGGVTTGGMATGGAATGGVATGGMATGGAATGGVATGGMATGGTATGGVATGGLGEDTGGADTGGSASGGAVGTGGQSGGYCPQDEPCRISPLGDSITEGINMPGAYRIELFRLALADDKSITFVGSRTNGPATVDGQSFPQQHEGTSGISIEGLQAEVEAGDLIREDVNPHIILLHIGTNNMYGSHPAEPAELLPGLIDSIIEDCPDALLVVAQIIPYAGVEAYNAAIPAIVDARAQAGAHIMLVDQYTGFPQSELEDGVHPNQAGYERMAGVWYEAISGYLP
jgi:lysophospholipase L1-like esterase